MTLFTTTSYPVSSLITNIELGKIGLPDLQRPFVWPNVNVRDLFDSLYRGYPAGFLLFWETGADVKLKGIGDQKGHTAPHLAIVDGQQRLTSLYAVIKGEEVIRANFNKERIRIAFNPLTERFAVSDAAIAKDKSFIADIAELWRPDVHIFEFARNFVSQLSSVRDVMDDEKQKIENAIGRLNALPNQYSFTALTLLASSDVATVADVFLRINGQGKELYQSDFIMTLMSVYWDEGRTELEDFSRNASKQSDDRDASPYNHFIKPSPDQMLRVTIGLALKRARLENVYNALRGRDAKTGVESPERRMEQFEIMRKRQTTSLKLSNWHHFLSALNLAGYRNEKMISSNIAIIYSYVLYLIGLEDYQIDKSIMRQAIAEFFFMAVLTGRYTGSSETRFDSDLAVVRDLSDGDVYLSKLREMCRTALTEDFWKINLPNQLATSAARSPSLFAYNASLIKLDATALYSSVKIASLIDPTVKGTKAAFERHHIFPRAYLEQNGITDLRRINQIANYALVEWVENIKIGKQAPMDYAPKLDAEMSQQQREEMYFWHALPLHWWNLGYDDFLVQRREKMAKVIEKAWRVINGENDETEEMPIDVKELIENGETDAVEFKAALRVNLHTGEIDNRIEMSTLKTIAGFLNVQGGTLLIGVTDDGDVLGVENDKFVSEDKMARHVTNLVRDRIGELFQPYVHPIFEDQESGRVLMVRCERGPKAAYVKEGSFFRFFVRSGNSTAELKGEDITDYVRQRFA